jgi:hypothetical protein
MIAGRVVQGAGGAVLPLADDAQAGGLDANLVALLFSVGMYAILAVLPRYLQTPVDAGYGFGTSVTASGIFLLPMTAMVFCLGLLADRWGPKSVLLAGVALTAVAFVLLTLEHEQRLDLYVFSALSGMGGEWHERQHPHHRRFGGDGQYCGVEHGYGRPTGRVPLHQWILVPARGVYPCSDRDRSVRSPPPRARSHLGHVLIRVDNDGQLGAAGGGRQYVRFPFRCNVLVLDKGVPVVRAELENVGRAHVAQRVPLTDRAVDPDPHAAAYARRDDVVTRGPGVKEAGIVIHPLITDLTPYGTAPETRKSLTRRRTCTSVV